jgi:hypothetical protein
MTEDGALRAAGAGLVLMTMLACASSCAHPDTRRQPPTQHSYYELAGVTTTCLDGVEYWVAQSMRAAVPDSIAVRIDPINLTPKRCEVRQP